MYQSQRGIGDRHRQLQSPLSPAVLTGGRGVLRDHRLARTAGQHLMILIEQQILPQRRRQLIELLLQAGEQHIHADHPHQGAVLVEGLRHGDHGAESEKVFVRAGENRSLVRRAGRQRILPEVLLVKGLVEAKPAGGLPGVEVDKVVHPDEVDPGDLLGQVFAGGGQQGGEAQCQMHARLPLAARGGEVAPLR